MKTHSKGITNGFLFISGIVRVSAGIEIAKIEDTPKKFEGKN